MVSDPAESSASASADHHTVVARVTVTTGLVQRYLYYLLALFLLPWIQKTLRSNKNSGQRAL